MQEKEVGLLGMNKRGQLCCGKREREESREKAGVSSGSALRGETCVCICVWV